MGGSVSSGAHLNSTPASKKIVSFNDLIEKKLDCSWTEIDITKSSELDSSNLIKPQFGENKPQSGGNKLKQSKKNKPKKSLKKLNRRKRQKKRRRKTGKRRRRK